MKISVRLVISLLLLFTCYFSLVTSAFAQATPTQSNVPPSTNINPDVPDNLHNWTQTVMIEVMSALSCQLTGIDPTTVTQQCLGVDLKTGKIGFLPSGNLEKGEVGGAIGTMGNMITMLYTPPIHTSDYFQNLASNFGITKSANAQVTGTGFEGLKPLLNLWTAFRNIVYLFFVIVFVIIGLAIMLRVKIDPRTVMTIQNQIPKIIIGILLITFSYAIAGFLIDMMYVSIHVVGNVIVSSDPRLKKELPTQLSRETNPFSAAGHVGAGGGNAATGFWSILYEPSKAIGETIINIFDRPLDLISSIMVKQATFFIPGNSGSWWHFWNWPAKVIGFALDPVADLLAKTLHVILGTIIGILAFIVIAIALLVALFRLWFTLLMAYVHILIDVVLAPFWIIGGLIPGSPINVSGWFRDLVANLAAFPATIVMFLLGKAFMDAFGKGKFSTPFVPPLIGDPIQIEAIGSLIGLGIILMTPNVVNMLKTALKAPKIDTGLGNSIGAGPALAMNVGKNIGGTLTGAEEVVMRKQPGGGYDWGERGIGRTLVGKILGR